jgi:hypothetical protein
VIALNNGMSGNTAAIPVGGLFSDGSQLQDALSGATYNVSGGNVSITLAARSGALLLPYPASVDLTPPVAQIDVTPTPNANGWNVTTPVTVKLSAMDAGGSGVSQLRYWLNGGPTNVVSGSSTTIMLSSQGSTVINVRAVDNAGNVSAVVTKTVMIDVTPPAITCSATPNVLWPPNGSLVPVTVSVSLRDAISGPAGFKLISATTNEPPAGNSIQGFTLGAASTSGSLLAQRNGSGTGRVYTLTYQGANRAGLTATCAATVIVPHDQAH